MHDAIMIYRYNDDFRRNRLFKTEYKYKRKCKCLSSIRACEYVYKMNAQLSAQVSEN